MDLHISLDGRPHLTDAIYRQLRDAILEGRLSPGDRLPPSRELARQLAVSRSTVTVAYDRLTSEGYTASRVGAGTYVSLDLVPRAPRTPPRPSALRARAIWDEVSLPTVFGRPAEFDFRAGIPDARLFPYDTWRRLMSRELRRSSVGKGAYGDPAGDAELRAGIAGHVALGRGVRAGADDIVVTNGTQQAFDVVARAILAPGDTVAVEDPGYPTVRQLLASLGARVIPVPVDDEGMDVAQLPGDARLVVVTPSHQFPLGVAMSLRRRLALVDWAEAHDAAVVEDDYDSEFRLGGRPIEPLQSLDPHGRVIYVGTFSKTMLATLRLGFVVVPGAVRHAVRAAKFVSDWHTAVPTQRALAAFIAEGWFARHLRRMRPIYRDRHRRIVEILERDFGGTLRPLPAAAGLHVCAVTPTMNVADVERVMARALETGVAAHLLSAMAAVPPGRPGLILGYGAIATEHIDEGMRRLRLAFG
ncbi:MAG TPA: PLP-dependent aminotransferase family protein [Candidatus Limnocylindria bacterium]|nr:PLP-dependent aminotransferase family protein [Candidatus Limnocylindria bacterium]